MSPHEGKGWAKGKTSATDVRVARAAARHRGMRYERHLTPEQDRRHQGRAARTLPLEWSAAMAYVVGLMATDGCLINTGRHLAFGSSDRQLVETFLRCLGRAVSYRTLLTATRARYFKSQFGDVRFYRWLQEVGLTQRKSLVLGGIPVPDELLPHLARGLLDGDGSLLNLWYDGGGKAVGKRYEGFITRFISASRETSSGSALLRVVGVRGNISAPSPSGACWGLNYAIRESCVLLPLLYPTEDVPKLERKWLVWRAYARRHGHPATLRELRGTSAGCASFDAAGPDRASRDSKGRFRTLSRAADL